MSSILMTAFLKALAMLMLNAALLIFCVWWLVPIATAGALEPAPAQAAGIVGIYYLYRLTSPTAKKE